MDAMSVSAVGMAAAVRRYGDTAGRLAGLQAGRDGKPVDVAAETADGISDLVSFKANAAVMAVSADLTKRTLDILV